MIQRKSPLRKSPVRKRRLGKPRRGPWRSVAYRRWIAARGCCVCGKPSQAAHTENGGMSMKGPDSSCVPLCPLHHDVFDGRVPCAHGLGAFDLEFGVNLREIAEALFDLWKRTRNR